MKKNDHKKKYLWYFQYKNVNSKLAKKNRLKSWSVLDSNELNEINIANKVMMITTTILVFIVFF